jgi:hypothetical protein
MNKETALCGTSAAWLLPPLCSYAGVCSEFLGVYQAGSAPFDLLTVVGVAVELVNVELTGGAPGPD